MKVAIFTVGLALLAGQASAHYIFQYLNSYPQYEYIRKNKDYNSPVTNLTVPELRCNVGGNNGTGTDTVTMAAGSLVKFTADVAVYHQGPVSFFIAKAPTTAALFDGSGTVWYKIKDIGPTFDASGNAHWDLEQSYNVTIPTCIAPGQYLLRIQQLAIHNPYPAGIPQFYLSCAQINVTGGGSGLKGTAVAIPGVFKATDPGYTVNIYNNFHNYTVPGGPVAKC